MSDAMVDLEMNNENSLDITPSTLEDSSGSGNGSDWSDLSNGPDGPGVKQTALQKFASALQEAQELAIQFERDQVSQK